MTNPIIDPQALLNVLPTAKPPLYYPGYSAWSATEDIDAILITGAYTTINYSGNMGLTYNFAVHAIHNSTRWILDDTVLNFDAPCDPCLEDYILDTIANAIRDYNDIIDNRYPSAVIQRVLDYITCDGSCDITLKTQLEITNGITTIARAYPYLLDGYDLIRIAGEILDIRKDIIDDTITRDAQNAHEEYIMITEEA